MSIDDIAAKLAWGATVGMSILGGVVSYIQRFEQDEVLRQRSRWAHFWGLVRQGIMSSFVGFIFYFSQSSLPVQPPLAFAFAGLAGYFGTKFLEALFARFIGRTPTQINEEISGNTNSKEVK